jgi:hypothetical protein
MECRQAKLQLAELIISFKQNFLQMNQQLFCFKQSLDRDDKIIIDSSTILASLYQKTIFDHRFYNFFFMLGPSPKPSSQN